MGRQIRSESHTIETDTNPRGRAPESVNPELIFRQISPLGGPATQSMTSFVARKKRVHRCQIRMTLPVSRCFWERVLSLVVVGARVLGASAVLLIQAVPPILHGFP